MKKIKKVKKATEVVTTADALDQGELEAPLAEMATLHAQEIAQYQKEVDDLREESKRKPRGRPQEATESNSYIKISGAVARALIDMRAAKLPDNLATAVALRAKEEAARLKISLPQMGPGKSWQDNIMIAALEGNEQFFKDLIDSFRALREQGFSLNSEGKWTKKTGDFKAKKHILSQWKSWEANAVQMKLREAEVKEKFAMNRKDFYKFINLLRSEPKSPL